MQFSQYQVVEFTKQFIMVTGYIIYPRPLGKKGSNIFDDFQVCFGKIVFTELPDIYDITVKDQIGWFYLIQID